MSESAPNLPLWSWADAYRRAGALGDGRFNAGAFTFPTTARLAWDTVDGKHTVLDPGDIEALVRKLANSLTSMGVREGDRVAGFMGRRPEALAAALAVWRIGAVYVPLFTSLGVEAIRVRLGDSGASAAVVDAANRARFGEAQGGADLRVLLVDGRQEGDMTLADDTSAGSIAETTLESAATIMYTSGTTTKPKGCVMAHRALVNLWPYVEYGLGLDPSDSFFSTADPGWTFGLLTTGLSPLSLGCGRILYEPGFDADAWWSAIERREVTHLASAPTGFRQLAAAGDELVANRDLKLRAASSAGEPLTPEVFRWFREKLSVTIHDGYGLTELGMLIVNLRVRGAPEAVESCMGVELPGFTLRIVDDQGEIMEGDGVGRIAVRDEGQLLSTTYWEREEEWSARLHDGWWVTEDVARRDHEGRYWYVGRSDDIIVTAGYNVSPNEVEAVLLEHPRIVDAACVGEPDPRKGHVIVAHVVVAGTDGEEELLDDLRRRVGDQLGWHAAPRRLHRIDVLPRTDSGKLRRKDLRGPS